MLLKHPFVHVCTYCKSSGTKTKHNSYRLGGIQHPAFCCSGSAASRAQVSVMLMKLCSLYAVFSFTTCFWWEVIWVGYVSTCDWSAFCVSSLCLVLRKGYNWNEVIQLSYRQIWNTSMNCFCRTDRELLRGVLFAQSTAASRWDLFELICLLFLFWNWILKCAVGNPLAPKWDLYFLRCKVLNVAYKDQYYMLVAVLLILWDTIAGFNGIVHLFQ